MPSFNAGEDGYLLYLGVLCNMMLNNNEETTTTANQTSSS